MSYINFYNGRVTEGGTNGKLVNSGNKITAVVKRGTEVSQVLAIRCEEGYTTNKDVILSFENGNNKWCFEVNGKKGEYGAPITLKNVGTVNKLFTLYTTAASDEEPKVDKTVKINIDTEVIPTA